MQSRLDSGARLAASITRAASRQTYTTIRFLVDSERVGDAYRAYAYFRWVDDWLDQEMRPRAERLAFVKRQQDLIERCILGQPPEGLSPEEGFLVSLIRRDPDRASGLQTYIRNMMAVMAFDADRRGRPISQRELNDYTLWLAVAVTEAMHYFIGHNCASPSGQTRYQAVMGAHITHMLRDTLEDVDAGYFNLPAEVMAAQGIAPGDVEKQAYRDWVRDRVQRGRDCFKTGRVYLAQVENLRCRIAGYAYLHRFEVVLDTIEREGFVLRAHYPERVGLRCEAEMIGWALWMALTHHRPLQVSSALPVR
jgi:phytoene/squalene synthetase